MAEVEVGRDSGTDINCSNGDNGFSSVVMVAAVTVIMAVAVAVAW